MSSKYNINIFESANMIIVFANVIFFMIVQTLFFEYVASKQFNIVLEDKANIVGEYLKNDPNANEKYRRFKNSDKASQIQTTAKKQEDKRAKENMENTMLWIGIPVLIAVAFLVFFIIKLIFKKEVWDTTDSVLLSFVVFAYMIEVLFYLGIVKQYQFYGDQSIYTKLYHTVNDKIQKEPITNQGKQMEKLLEGSIDMIIERSGTIEDVRKYFNENKNKFSGLDEGFVLSYARAKMSNIAGSINMSILNQVESDMF